MEVNYPSRYHLLKSLIGKIGQATSSPLADFSHLHREALASGAITAKHKELIALGIAIAQRCDDCIAYHVHDALQAGATREEIMETAGVAVMMGGGPAVMYSCRVYEALEQFAGREATVAPSETLLGTGVSGHRF
jgi:AhpD family alkylhydroperoxidase